MHAFSRILVFLLGIGLLLSLSFSHAQVVPGNSASNAYVPLLSIVFPQNVSLQELIIRENVMRKSWEEQTESFVRVQSQLENASVSEREDWEKRLLFQRINVSNAYMNFLIVSLQKTDWIISNLETALVRLYILHRNKRASGKVVENFGEEYASLKNEWEELNEERNALKEKLGEIIRIETQRVERSAELRNELVSLQNNIKRFFSHYTRVLKEVLAA